jgi:hypothetical protein
MLKSGFADSSVPAWPFSDLQIVYERSLQHPSRALSCFLAPPKRETFPTNRVCITHLISRLPQDKVATGHVHQPGNRRQPLRQLVCMVDGSHNVASAKDEPELRTSRWHQTVQGMVEPRGRCFAKCLGSRNEIAPMTIQATAGTVKGNKRTANNNDRIH